MSIPSSTGDAQLFLTASELQILHQQQQIVSQQLQRDRGVPASRGRGESRSSQPSSRAVSAASSAGTQNRLILDPHSLSRLNANLDDLIRRIEDRIDDLQEATTASVNNTYDRAGNMTQDADREIARMKAILAKIDALDEDVIKLKRIREVVRQFRRRVDDADRRLDRSSSSSHGHGYGHGHGHGRSDRDRDRDRDRDPRRR